MVNEVYIPIPEQVAKLGEQPILADLTTVEGLRTLIRNGVESGFFSASQERDLTAKLETAQALRKLMDKGIVVNE